MLAPRVIWILALTDTLSEKDEDEVSLPAMDISAERQGGPFVEIGSLTTLTRTFCPAFR